MPLFWDTATFIECWKYPCIVTICEVEFVIGDGNNYII
jgi:hypothetical protein